MEVTTEEGTEVGYESYISYSDELESGKDCHQHSSELANNVTCSTVSDKDGSTPGRGRVRHSSTLPS